MFIDVFLSYKVFINGCFAGKIFMVGDMGGVSHVFVTNDSWLLNPTLRGSVCSCIYGLRWWKRAQTALITFILSLLEICGRKEGGGGQRKANARPILSFSSFYPGTDPNIILSIYFLLLLVSIDWLLILFVFPCISIAFIWPVQVLISVHFHVPLPPIHSFKSNAIYREEGGGSIVITNQYVQKWIYFSVFVISQLKQKKNGRFKTNAQKSARNPSC